MNMENRCVPSTERGSSYRCSKDDKPHSLKMWIKVLKMPFLIHSSFWL